MAQPILSRSTTNYPHQSGDQSFGTNTILDLTDYQEGQFQALERASSLLVEDSYDISPSLHMFNDNEKAAFYAVYSLADEGYFNKDEDSPTGFDLKASSQRHALAVALRYFDSKDDLKELGKADFPLCLYLREKARERSLLGRLQLPDVNSRPIGGLKVSDKAWRFIRKFEGAMEIADWIGIISSDSHAMTECEYNRLKPHIPPHEIPALLNGPIQMEDKLKTTLLCQYVQHLENSGPTGIDHSHITPEELLAAGDALQYTVQEMDRLQVNINGKAQDALEKQAEALLPQKEVEHQKAMAEKLEKKLSSKEFRKKATQVGKEVAHSVHAWVQWSKQDRQRSEASGKALQKFKGCMDALGLNFKIETFRHRSWRDIQQIISDEIMAKQRKGSREIIEITAVYAQEVARTKEDIRLCESIHDKLGKQGQPLKKLADVIGKHQKTANAYYKKASKALRSANAVCDAVVVAGMITSMVPGGQAAGAVMIQAGQSGKEVTNEGRKRLNRQWDNQHSWYMGELGALSQAGQRLHESRSSYQGYMDQLQFQRERQRDFLLLNPELFRTRTYQRNLRLEIEESERRIHKLETDITLSEKAVRGHEDHLNTLAPEHRKRQKAVNKLPKKRKKKKIIEAANRRLARLERMETEIANIHADRAEEILNQQHLKEQLRTEIAEQKKLIARLEESKEAELIPLHHQAIGQKLTPKEILTLSASHLCKLRSEIQELKKSSSLVREQDIFDKENEIHLEQLLYFETDRIETLEKVEAASPAALETQLVEACLSCDRRSADLQIEMLEPSIVKLERLKNERKNLEKKAQAPGASDDDKDNLDTNRTKIIEQEAQVRNIKEAIQGEKQIKLQQIFPQLAALPPENRVEVAQEYGTKLSNDYQAFLQKMKEQPQEKARLEPIRRSKELELRDTRTRLQLIERNAALEIWEHADEAEKVKLREQILKGSDERWVILRDCRNQILNEIPGMEAAGRNEEAASNAILFTR